jgi:hypothetical protein
MINYGEFKISLRFVRRNDRVSLNITLLVILVLASFSIKFIHICKKIFIK